jgi:ankyrin repeat protein
VLARLNLDPAHARMSTAWSRLLAALTLALLLLAPPVAVDGGGEGLSVALKFTLDLQLSKAQEDAVVDKLLGESAAGSASLADAVAALSRRHDSAASPRAAEELLALVERPAAPEPINSELTAALKQRDWPRAQALLGSAEKRERRPLTEPSALAVGDEPALAYVLRREAALPILSRTSAAIATARTLCERGVDAAKRGRDGVAPLVLAARFRDADLCRCIVTQQQADDHRDQAAALLELLDYGRNRGWCVALSRSLMVVPAGGGSRSAFSTDVMMSAMAASEPLRRLHAEAAAATGSAEITVGSQDVAEANEAWVLPTASALLTATANPNHNHNASSSSGGSSDSSSSTMHAADFSAAGSRDAFERTVLHLAALNGWTKVIAMLRTAPLNEPTVENGSECREQPGQQQQQQQQGQGVAAAAGLCGRATRYYLPSSLALAVDVFGRTALHLAAGRGDSAAAAALLDATGMKTPCLRHVTLNMIIYQDRLGTNIGKVEKRVALFLQLPQTELRWLM